LKTYVYIIYMDFCKYRNVFGEPGKGAHSYRIFNIAIIDVIFTILLVLLICWITKWTFWRTLVVTFIIGIFAHRLFCVRTTVDKFLFPNA
jgi:hypothetical protein